MKRRQVAPHRNRGREQSSVRRKKEPAIPYFRRMEAKSTRLRALVDDYRRLVEELQRRLPAVGRDDLMAWLGIGAPTYYAKRSGRLSLTPHDVAVLVEKLGTDVEKGRWQVFDVHRTAAAGWLKHSGLKINQTLPALGMTNREWNKRQQDPTTWKLEELVKLADLLNKLPTL